MGFAPGTLLAPFMPPVETARHYSFYKLRKDLVAGLTVSVVEVPQAMAYAIIAGVPPVYGLYTSMIQGVIGALLSSSEHMTTGPTNTQSLLIASAVHRIVSDNHDARYLELVFALAMIKGLLQLAFAAARMGNMVRYVSRSVIVGLVSGAGLLIFFGQLPAFLGITSRAASPWPGIFAPFQTLIGHACEIDLHAIGIGAAALAIMIAVRLVNPLLPGALIAVAASIITIWLTGTFPSKLLIERLPPSLPHFHVPRVSWGLTEELFGGALALAVIGMLESVSIAKAIASHTGERISANQEFFAQGLKNFVTSFFQCMPGSGSFGRSALDYAAGAQTRFAAVFNALFVAAIFLLFGRWAAFIPKATLAAVLFMIAYTLIDWRYILRLARASRSDTIVCVVTLAATLLVPLEYAIFIGIFLNIGLYLRQASRLHLNEMLPSPIGRPFIEMPVHDRSGHKRVIFLQLEGDLFFAVADELQDRLTALASSGVRIVILRLKRTLSIDATALHVLEKFVREMRDRSGYVLLCGVKPELMRSLRQYGLLDLIGRANVFETRTGVFESAKLALDRARELAGVSIDMRPLEANIADEPITYEI